MSRQLIGQVPRQVSRQVDIHRPSCHTGTYAHVNGVGAVAGAAVGAVVAIPVQIAASWGWSRYDQRLSKAQQNAVDAAVERHYGVRC